MPINIDTFRAAAEATSFSSRDIIVKGEGKQATAKLGNFIFSQGKTANNATMAAFKRALEQEFGTLGTHAFDTVVGARSQLNKSLRACDVRKTLSSLKVIRENRFVGELNRQLDISPKMMELSKDDQKAVRRILHDAPFENIVLEDCKTPADVSKAAAKRINAAIETLRKERNFGLETKALGARKSVETSVGAGVNKLMDNVGYILDNAMPEDERQRTDLLDVLTGLIEDFTATTTESADDLVSRIGNEIMIDAKDLR